MHTCRLTFDVNSKVTKLFSSAAVLSRVVSSEISPGKFPEIYSNLSGNFRKFVKYFFHFIIFNYNHIKEFNNKHVFHKQLSRSLCFNLMH